MSTKGLMADKRVEHVELNALGKASHLTLKAPWEFEGGQGPFALKNVQHGHDIVKSATDPTGTAGGRSKAPKAPRQPADPSEPYDGPPAPSKATLAAIVPAKLGHQVWIYRTVLVSKIDQREVTGWVKSTAHYSKGQLKEKTTDQLAHLIKVGSASDYEVESYRWTTCHEKRARADNTAGCPWPTEVTV